MKAEERKIFWDALLTMHDASPEKIEKLMSVSECPRYLCRFRSVSENSLLQLQENKQYFSSADYYDDPFDTYFRIDIEHMRSFAEDIKRAVMEENSNCLSMLKMVSAIIGQDADFFKSVVSQSMPDFGALKEKLGDIRKDIQTKLFSICFCENSLNETLWLKYANSHKGFVQIYDMNNSDTFLYGKETECVNCSWKGQNYYVYPIYYGDERYDASAYAMFLLLMNMVQSGQIFLPPAFTQIVSEKMMWEAERISLIKKKCHEYDQEWRMIRPQIMPVRTCIKLKPCKVVVGLRMPEPERKLVSSAAKIAGIPEIHEVYINEHDELDTRPLQEV